MASQLVYIINDDVRIKVVVVASEKERKVRKARGKRDVRQREEKELLFCFSLVINWFPPIRRKREKGNN